MKRLCNLLLMGILCGFSTAQAMETDPRSESQFYIDSFGIVADDSFPLLDRVESVFERLLRVADKAEYKDPGLLLIDSPDWPWAIALPDNNIILSKGAVALCYQGVSQARGDARLAMILGHELGHLAEDDYWHRDVYLSLSSRNELEADNVMRFIGERSGLVNADSEEWQTIVRDRELKADDRGFIYAALAGFDTRLLLGEGESSFFHYWTKQTSVSPDQYHLTPGDRAAYLKARSGTLTDVAELFRFGLMMTYLGEYDTAEKVFRDVLTKFPAHEVYNNLGYIQLQKGLARVSVDASDVFWFPSTLDSAPETPEILSRSIGNDYLGEAAQFFKLAIKQNPAYLNGYLNLATTYYYQEKYNSAAAILAESRNIVGTLPEVEGLWQIAMLQSLKGTVDYRPIALASLSALAKTQNPPLSLLFNLAQLYEQSGDQVSAKRTWLQLAQSPAAIPAPYHFLVDLKSGTDSIAMPSSNRDLGQFLQKYQQVGDISSQTKSFGIRLGGDNLQRLTDTAGAQQYRTAANPHLRMSAIRAGVPQTALAGCCGDPSMKHASGLGDIWVYGNQWAVLVNNGAVEQVWQNLSLK